MYFRLLVVVIASLLLCEARYGVALTTIPPRFDSLEPVILSMVSQVLVPDIIFVFVPMEYKRFKWAYDVSPKQYLQGRLNSFCSVLTNKCNGKVLVQETPDDWGPATKLVGLIWVLHMTKTSASNLSGFISHWVVCDDDVFYTDELIAKYHRAVVQKQPQNGKDEKNGYVYTFFSPDQRVSYFSERFQRVNRMLHIQGVDTIMLSTSSLMSNPVLSYDMFSASVSYFHAVCPGSFYQDDYVFSFLFHLAGLEVNSLWDANSQMVDHVEGVSKSNQQMHMENDVFEKEQETQLCITEHANNLINLLESEPLP